MCRGADLGVCIATGCDERIVCRDDGGHCPTHSWQRYLCWCENDCSCPKMPEYTVDPEKQRLYDLGQTQRQIRSAEARITSDTDLLVTLRAREQALTKASS